MDALIFDLDGTLADTETLHFQAWRETLLNNGVKDFPFETFLNYVGTSNEKVAGDYTGPGKIEKSVKELIAEKQTLYMTLIPQVELYPGVAALMEASFGKMQLAVASSSHEKEVRAILEHHGLTRWLSVIYCGDMVGNKKPDPEIYLKTAAALGVAAKNCLAFEDSEHGVNAAKAAGMWCVAVPNRFTGNHDYRAADRIIESFTEVDAGFLASFKAD